MWRTAIGLLFSSPSDETWMVKIQSELDQKNIVIYSAECLLEIKHSSAATPLSSPPSISSLMLSNTADSSFCWLELKHKMINNWFAHIWLFIIFHNAHNTETGWWITCSNAPRLLYGDITPWIEVAVDVTNRLLPRHSPCIWQNNLPPESI